MKFRYYLLLVLIGFCGCNSEQASDTDSENTSPQQSSSDDAPTDSRDDQSGNQDKLTIDPAQKAPVMVTHVVTVEEVYYLDGPQQMRPPDGKFKMGTRVELVQDAGSYSEVVSEDGIRAYVSTGVLKPIE